MWNFGPKTTLHTSQSQFTCRSPADDFINPTGASFLSSSQSETSRTMQTLLCVDYGQNSVSVPEVTKPSRTSHSAWVEKPTLSDHCLRGTELTRGLFRQKMERDAMTI